MEQISSLFSIGGGLPWFYLNWSIVETFCHLPQPVSFSCKLAPAIGSDNGGLLRPMVERLINLTDSPAVPLEWGNLVCSTFSCDVSSSKGDNNNNSLADEE
jgi:hypothetical protein